LDKNPLYYINEVKCLFATTKNAKAPAKTKCIVDAKISFSAGLQRKAEILFCGIIDECKILKNIEKQPKAETPNNRNAHIPEKEVTLKGDPTTKDNVNNTPYKIEDFKSLCWSCSVKEVKLFKCGGCFKARYCSEKCIQKDWPEHMNYCLKKQEKIKKKNQLTGSEGTY